MLDDLNVMVVEDEALIAMDVSDHLEGQGAIVLGPFGTLDEALATEVRPDVAVLDVDLHGRRVFPLADQLADRGVPFVFHTGRADLEELQARYGNVPVVAKPSMPDELVRMLSTVL